ncbi:MAG TPA: lamin tail domain-containing protein [Oculatellaceae cyanobacterium]|jgi:predicted extracellular nuclease
MANLFFSEYIEGSSNNKALEIYNGTGGAINLATEGYVVQMYFNGSTTAGLTINLTGTVANGDVFVLAQAAANATILAQADQTSSASWFNGDDAIVLRKGGINGTVIDSLGQIGVAPGTEWGTRVTSTADNTLRRKSTIAAGDTNPNDVFDPSSQWDGFATDTFGNLGNHTTEGGGGSNAPTVSIIATDAEAAEQGANQATFRITRTGDTSAELIVNYTVATGTGQATNGNDYTPNLTGTAVIAAGQSFVDITITPADDSTVEGNETVTLTLTDTVAYDLGSSSTATVTLADNDVSITPIYQIQGAGHTSSLVGQTVTTKGIVTAVDSNGFYLQDASGDSDDLTSDGIFVFTSSAPTVAVGAEVQVGGSVSEFTPGGASSGNLSSTQISSPTVTTLSTGNSLPAGTVLGAGGRTPPTAIIDNDNFATFDPAEDGIDFYESLEGMRVQINNAVSVSPTNQFGEVYVLADNGANATGVNSRGGITVNANDLNPERIQIQADLGITPGFSTPQVNVGAQLGNVTGVVSYGFGNFEVLATQSFTPTSTGVTRETTNLVGTADQLTVANYNVENLDPSDGSARFNAIANQIVSDLKSPDIISLQEIQDNNGSVNDSVVDALLTGQTLIDAIVAAGGPRYQYLDIPPVDDQSGGEPGGNIRVGYLYNPNRVDFVEGSLQRIEDPNLADGNAFQNSRNSLSATFEFNSKQITLINNHFTSKGGSTPLYGTTQPSVNGGEAQRTAQATVVNDYVKNILDADPNANVAVVGDLNEFYFNQPLQILEQNLTNLTETLPENERYSYVFEGNSQELDHVLVSNNLANVAEYDPVHINAEFADQISDHDPLVARFNLPKPTINGTSKRDVLTGLDESERIVGFEGHDLITGGGGRDEFIYKSFRDVGDRITDFEIGIDKIVLTELLDSLGYSGSDPFADGYIQLEQRGFGTSIQIDPDGSIGQGIFRPFIAVENTSATALNNTNNLVL